MRIGATKLLTCLLIFTMVTTAVVHPVIAASPVTPADAEQALGQDLLLKRYELLFGSGDGSGGICSVDGSLAVLVAVRPDGEARVIGLDGLDQISSATANAKYSQIVAELESQGFEIIECAAEREHLMAAMASQAMDEGQCDLSQEPTAAMLNPSGQELVRTVARACTDEEKKAQSLSECTKDVSCNLLRSFSDPGALGGSCTDANRSD